MALKQVLEAFELLDSAVVTGDTVIELLRSRGISQIETRRLTSPVGSTQTLRLRIPGRDPKAPVLGVIGKLGGVGARPSRVGMVSDADGAIAAVAMALKLAAMNAAGDVLPGDVIITTHICPDAPTRPHHPVPFMSSPVDRAELGRIETDPAMDAVLSIDTSRGNRVVNHKGIAVTPTVREGFILPVSNDLLDILEAVTATRAVVMPLSTQDITPYANNLFHINSILQPAVFTNVPVVGVAVTAEVAVPGCATGANQLDDIEKAVRFSLEVAKAFGAGACSFHDEEEFRRLVEIYGSMRHLQTAGKEAA
jgi:hypothetical protein